MGQHSRFKWLAVGIGASFAVWGSSTGIGVGAAVAAGRDSSSAGAGHTVAMDSSATRDAAPESADSLEVAQNRIHQGNFSAAELLARRLVGQLDAVPMVDSLRTAKALYLLSESLWRGNKAKDPETRQAAERSLAIRESVLGPAHPEVGKAINNLGNLLRATGDYAGARPLYERALAIMEAALGPEHPDVAPTLNNLAVLRINLGEYAGARPLMERALAILERAKGPEHRDVAATLTNLGTVRQAMGDHAGAQSLLERSLSIQEKRLGPDHPDLATSLNNLAALRANLGDPAGAGQLFERALAIWEKALGPEHPQVAQAIHNLALRRRSMGDFAGARTLFVRALALQEKSLGPEHPDVGHSLHNLGVLCTDMGDYTGARRHYERALAIVEKVLGPEHSDLAQSLHNLANLNVVMGDYPRAEELYRRALGIQEHALGAGHADVAITYNNLANLRHVMGDPAGARALQERALAIQEVALGPEHRDFANGLSNLASLHQSVGDFAAARPLVERALAILEKKLGPNHPDVARTMLNLAIVHSFLGDSAGARPLLERAQMIVEKALGPEHPLLATILAATAALEALAGRPMAALRAALRAESIGRAHFQRTAERLSEREALGYSAVRVAGLDLALSLVSAGVTPDAVGEVFDAVIRSRALVLDEMAMRHRSAGGTEAAERILRQKLVEASTGYANLVVRGPDPAFPRRFRSQLDQAREAQETAERALAEASVPYGRARTQRRAGLSEVMTALPPGSALVAFVRYGQRPPGSALMAVATYEQPAPASGDETGGGPDSGAATPSYLAFVVPAGGDLRVVRLGAAAEVDSLVGRWQAVAEHGARSAGSAGAERIYRPVAAALRQRVWDPIVPLLTGAERVFVVPEGSLNLVNLAALPSGESDYLIETGPLVHYLSAERDLVVESGERATGAGLLAVGGPAYDTGVAALAAVPAGSGASSYRGARAGCGDIRQLHFVPLPGSSREVEEVTASWRRWGAGGAARKLTGAAASEEAFKREAPGHRVLHVATHGFFMNGRCPSALEGRHEVGGLALAVDGRPVAPSGDNPLLLAGLALAGANQRETAGAEEEDGILSAEEIGALDLTGVEWAVLSACGSGVGEVRAGEGVFGLRRAFQVAGAKALIMSLWPVDDQTTRLWMGRLYKARLIRRASTAEAVREASLELLRMRRKQGPSTHPFHWGAFVAAGDWR